MNEVVYVLRAASGLTWFAVLIWFIPAFIRVLMNRPRYFDPLRSILMFVGISNLLFNGRHLLWPRPIIPPLTVNEFHWWAAAYLISIITGIALIWVERGYASDS